MTEENQTETADVVLEDTNADSVDDGTVDVTAEAPVAAAEPKRREPVILDRPIQTVGGRKNWLMR